ncbi:MAG TPA: nitrate reductase [Acidimicrobiales bacterium]|nr:nitrate reductase [Acidimicrobiales bacterium]
MTDGEILNADRIADPWGPRAPFGQGADWQPRVDQVLTVDEHVVDRWVSSACVMCSYGCGLEIAVAGDRIVGVRGRAEDRVNHGRLGPKGLYAWQANSSSDRLTAPLIRRDGELVPTDWETAMDAVVSRSKQLLDEIGPSAISFYTSGQLFLEEYYVLAMLARGGIGTQHLDGNTRLCTATAEWALIESFGADGDPGSYTDIDHCDALLLVGHNVAETQTVMWARMLDRRHGPDRPHLVVIDPRRTPAAVEADVHLAIKPGTNVMVLNALLHEMIANDWVDHPWVDAHTVGFEELARVVSGYPPERAAEVCGVEADDIRAAARILGTSSALVSTVLQGVYQSHQATAAAIQVNNINLLRAMIGRPGATVFQMNGQPTAQNTREAGADGSLPVQMNWQNDDHDEALARHWKIDTLDLPHWGPPTHVMQIMRYIETGSINFLWVSGTNPAVSLPELARIRSLLAKDDLFLVVSDAFMTETAAMADVVLPAALWGEKTGTFTNADRTVHLSEQAVAPPGQARSDFHIFTDYAHRMGLENREGRPLIEFASPEAAFDDFARLSAGRPSDYSAFTYDKLRQRNGMQWPCNEDHPDGQERLYGDGVFWTHADRCQSFGHDLTTGAANESDEYRAHDPNGRAVLKAAQYSESYEPPTDDYPFRLTTGRTVYHFHTRTKTGRAPELAAAAPDMWVELCPQDAEAHGIAEGDLVKVSSPRGAIHAPARLTGSRPGVVFAPFHYGYWDQSDDPDRHDRAANELTLTAWDPVSKQPTLKSAAVAVSKAADGAGPAVAPQTAASATVTEGGR